MKKAQLQITIINAVIASLSTLNIKQEVILYIQSNIIILLVLTFVSFRNNQQSNVVVNVLKELLMFISS
jgi:predicted membrane protein